MQEYVAQRGELIRAAEPGIASARRLSRLTDETLRALAESAAGQLRSSARWSLIALGGYGSGALLPGSDLDLLLISDAAPRTLKPFVEALLYPLWDAGLDVGHQVRSRRDQLRAARSDLTILTSALTGRTIAGDDSLGLATLEVCAADARKRSSAVLEQIHARPRPGSPYLLEPNIKEGAGGRRDFDELTWTAAVLTGAPQSDPSALVSLGLLTSAELERLKTAAEAVAAARWELAVIGAGAVMAEDLAADLTVDAGLVQQSLADTHHLLLTVRARLAGAAHGDPDPLSATDVLEIATTESDALPRLEQAAWSGQLDTLVPGFSALMALRRPGLAHTLTVGAHCLAAAVLLPHIGDRDGSGRALGGEIARRSAAAITDMRIPVVAAIVHDIGKETSGPGHAERGAHTAEVAARRFGLEESARDVAELVRLHLLLAEVASREDLDTEDAILRAARSLGDRHLLAPLHLLTIADSIATGPSAWTEWNEALLGKLVTRLDTALSPEVDGAGIASLAEETRAAALAGVPPGSREAEFIATAPVRYLADRDPIAVTRHAFLMAGLAGHTAAGAHELEVGAGPIAGSFDVTVAARDRHGLFSAVAGALALSAFDILAAQAVTVGSGLALDTFTVCSATRAEIHPEVWTRFDRNLDAALRDRLAISIRLAERQRHYRQPEPGALRVDVDTSDPYAAVVTIHADDRVGLLFDVSRAIADSGLDIVGVTATTRNRRAIDTFRLVDRDGQIPAEGLLGQLAMRLRELG